MQPVPHYNTSLEGWVVFEMGLGWTVFDMGSNWMALCTGGPDAVAFVDNPHSVVAGAMVGFEKEHIYCFLCVC